MSEHEDIGVAPGEQVARPQPGTTGGATLHTPGPWVVWHDGHYPRVRKQFRTDHHMDVCGPVHGYMYSDDERGEQDANARLIAAAPDLLDALRLILPLAKGYAPEGQTATARRTCNSWIEAAEAAIARAEGLS